MDISLRFLGLAGAASALVGLGHVAACTSDKGDPGEQTGGSGASTPAGGAGGMTSSTAGVPGSGTGGGATASDTVCASPILIDSTKPAIADFDTYDGSDLSKWTFAWGGDSSAGVWAGPFGYGDRSNDAGKTDVAETFDTAAGHNSTYALRVADTLAQNYGGGLGLWISACVNATGFAGLSFWVRGNCPTNKGTLTLTMQETLSTTPSKAGDKVGTCPGTNTGPNATCVHPTFEFPLTDTWTQIQAPWAGFKAGSSMGTPVTPDGRNINQLQLAVGLNWVPGDGGEYVAVPAPYELVVDTIAFY